MTPTSQVLLNSGGWVSLSGSDAVAVFDFATKKEVAYLPVGDHPQRIRFGAILSSLLS